MPLSISEEEREKAVQCIIEAVPGEMLLQIHDGISRTPDLLVLQHFGIGIKIRNLLRVNGFAWNDGTLDREWGPIAVEAARNVHGGA